MLEKRQKKKNQSVLSISLDKNIAKQEFSDAQNRQLDYAKYLKQYTIIVISTRKDKLKPKVIENLKVIPTNSRIKILAVWDAVKIGWQENLRSSFDVITTQDPIATGLIGILLKWLVGRPLNIQLHSEFVFSQSWVHEKWLHHLWVPFIGWQLHQADSIRVVSRLLKQQLKRCYPNLKAKVFVAPIRVDLNFFWQRARRKEQIKNLISVGRLAVEKNYPLLVRAMRKIREKYPQVRLKIVGCGPMEENLKRLVQQYGLGNSVELTGSLSRDQVRKELHRADLFVLASNYEGWGLVFVEAFAAGLPVVATQVGCVGEIVKNGENGWVVPVDDERELAKKIIDLIEHPNRAYYFGLMGQTRVKQDFSPKKLVGKWIKGLQETQVASIR